MDYKLTNEEKETVIRGNAASQEWDIVTADPRIKRMMVKKGWKETERVNPWGYISYKVPFDSVRILHVERKKRELTERQKLALQAHSFSKGSRSARGEKSSGGDM